MVSIPSGADISPLNAPPRGTSPHVKVIFPVAVGPPYLITTRITVKLPPHLFTVPMLIYPSTDLHCKFTTLAHSYSAHVVP